MQAYNRFFIQKQMNMVKTEDIFQMKYNNLYHSLGHVVYCTICGYYLYTIPNVYQFSNIFMGFFSFC